MRPPTPSLKGSNIFASAPPRALNTTPVRTCTTRIPASDAGIRVVHVRTGVVLSARGGALAKMLLPFKLGVGGRIGTGSQFMSWIALDDVVRAFMFALETESLSGAVNAVAPRPVTNAEFTRTLGGVLGRPTVFP